MFHVPNQYRNRTHRTYGTGDHDGNKGAFEIPLENNRLMIIIADDGLDAPEPHQWEHISVRIVDNDGSNVTPSWADMNAAKNVFWDAEDCVVQFHPPRSQYVNRHPHVLHMWRSVNWRMPQPPKWMV